LREKSPFRLLSAEARRKKAPELGEGTPTQLMDGTLLAATSVRREKANEKLRKKEPRNWFRRTGKCSGLTKDLRLKSDT